MKTKGSTATVQMAVARYSKEILNKNPEWYAQERSTQGVKSGTFLLLQEGSGQSR